MSCISCKYSCENYKYSREEDVDILYRTCEKRNNVPVGDDETCEYDTGLKKEISQNSTIMIDGITLCCGYDFGLDQFDIKIGYCPICGRKITIKK